MSLLKDFKKSAALILTAGALLLNLSSKAQNAPVKKDTVSNKPQTSKVSKISMADKKDIQEDVVLDEDRNIKMHYDLDKNQFVVSRDNQIVKNYKASNYFKNHLSEVSVDAPLEYMHYAKKATGNFEYAMGEFLLQPANNFHISAGYNQSNSPYFKGRYFKWQGDFAAPFVGPNTGKNLKIFANYINYRNDPNGVHDKYSTSNDGSGQSSSVSYEYRPNHSQLGIELATDPRSPIDAAIGGGADCYFNSEFLNTASLFAQGRLGVHLWANRPLSLKIGAQASIMQLNKSAYYFADNTAQALGNGNGISNNKRTALTGGIEVSLIFTPSNIVGRMLHNEKNQKNKGHRLQIDY